MPLGQHLGSDQDIEPSLRKAEEGGTKDPSSSGSVSVEPRNTGVGNQSPENALELLRPDAGVVDVRSAAAGACGRCAPFLAAVMAGEPVLLLVIRHADTAIGAREYVPASAAQERP